MSCPSHVRRVTVLYVPQRSELLLRIRVTAVNVPSKLSVQFCTCLLIPQMSKVLKWSTHSTRLLHSFPKVSHFLRHRKLFSTRLYDNRVARIFSTCVPNAQSAFIRGLSCAAFFTSVVKLIGQASGRLHVLQILLVLSALQCRNKKHWKKNCFGQGGGSFSKFALHWTRRETLHALAGGTHLMTTLDEEE